MLNALAFVSLLAASPPSEPADSLVADAIATARRSNQAEIFAPYLFSGGMIAVQTPFLKIAARARDAFDRYLPFTPQDVNPSMLADTFVTIEARDEKHSFKHVVIAISPPAAAAVERSPAPAASPEPPLTYEESLRREKAARKRRSDSKGHPSIELLQERARAIAQRRDAERAKQEAERARRAAMTIAQPTTIEATQHVWQNAFSATFTTAGVRATFPRELIAPGNEIRAVLADGQEVTVELTPSIVLRLR